MGYFEAGIGCLSAGVGNDLGRPVIDEFLNVMKIYSFFQIKVVVKEVNRFISFSIK